MRSDGYFGPTSAHSAERARGRGAEDACQADGLISDALARIVEGEILPRLAMLHQPAGRADPTLRQPTSAEIDRFHAVLLSVETADHDGVVAELIASGMTLDTLLVDLMAPAARHLGALWDQDLCDFLAVTIGLGRLHTITHRLCAELEETSLHAGRSILLVPSPGETHLYALSIVASFFRKAGWDVMIVERALPDAPDCLREMRFDAVGLSLSCDVCLTDLKATVEAMRRASRNPALAVVVGGPWVARNGAKPDEVNADIFVTDGRSAPRVTEAFLDARAKASAGEGAPRQTGGRSV